MYINSASDWWFYLRSAFNQSTFTPRLVENRKPPEYGFFPPYPRFLTPMSASTSSNGTEAQARKAELETVVAALRRLALHSYRVRLSEIVADSGLDSASVEQAMGQIERVSPLSAKRVGGCGDQVTWEIDL